MGEDVAGMVSPVNSVTRRTAFYMAAIVLWVVSFVFGIYHLTFLFTAVVSTFALSFLWVKVSHLSLRVSVRGPSEVTCGDEFELTVEVANDSKLMRSLIEVMLPKQRWLNAINGSQRILLAIPAHRSVSVEFKLKALKRGVYNYDHVLILVRDPFGLFNDVKRFPCECKVVVLPKVVNIYAMWHVAGEVLTEVSYGDGDVSRLGMEFYGVREYRPGDPWRRIHWKATAHTGKLSIIELEREKQGNVILLVDCDVHSHWGSGVNASIEHAVTIAASIANELLLAGATVTLVAEPFVQSPGLTVDVPRELKTLLYELAAIEPSSAPSLAEVVQKLRQVYGRSVGIVAVCTARTPNTERIVSECDACAIVYDGFARITHGVHDSDSQILRLPMV
ncbi:MAG: DUF58 domain-containing protein [Armatimonadota bacterium]|nr:DUF58 domain-containing protein [Armatimonadota bacterium]MCX7778151.1 DUF58 domain-containing protein [Armatimonadota bacterium]MDW8024505.1 DUF58 domain-containing protein [Armatimonadota bacterium]